MLDDAHAKRRAVDGHEFAPKAIVVPHAGHRYSGRIAAAAYALLGPAAATVRRVVLLGPAHRSAVDGFAASTADAFATPLGEVPLEPPPRGTPDVVVDAEPHAREHSLEVQLPFLQVVLPDGFRLVPLAAGTASPQRAAAAIEALWGGDETLVVVSTDLSHHLPRAAARAADDSTLAAVTGLRPAEIQPTRACGAVALAGLVEVARRRGLRFDVLARGDSGDASAATDSVVGYASLCIRPLRAGAFAR